MRVRRGVQRVCVCVCLRTVPLRQLEETRFRCDRCPCKGHMVSAKIPQRSPNSVNTIENSLRQRRRLLRRATVSVRNNRFQKRAQKTASCFRTTTRIIHYYKLNNYVLAYY